MNPNDFGLPTSFAMGTHLRNEEKQVAANDTNNRTRGNRGRGNRGHFRGNRGGNRGNNRGRGNSRATGRGQKRTYDASFQANDPNNFARYVCHDILIDPWLTLQQHHNCVHNNFSVLPEPNVATAAVHAPSNAADLPPTIEPLETTAATVTSSIDANEPLNVDGAATPTTRRAPLILPPPKNL